eukprot:gnl/MRDRNA2_/MRDRNA2_85990_c5_seq25.p1 gnl/MRDRNA2_/MRDRNA2_85990_c5~~gnl/MRDRNA2_/MRDRNA2_85990_c5_seq25.p1  ORF type:complete len:125 (-),score=4.34 gnl/MRDRNA2_/MRDRNA2_85990_c5_seq25:14-388(-)
MPRCAAVANVANSSLSFCPTYHLHEVSPSWSLWDMSPPTVAMAHAMLASPCGLKFLMRFLASDATAANSKSSFWPITANAHAMLASCCVLKSPVRRSDIAINLLKSINKSQSVPTRNASTQWIQ